MSEHINLHDSLSRAYWSGCFSCTDLELTHAISVTGSTDAAEVGLFLATRHVVTARPRRHSDASEVSPVEAAIKTW